MGFFKAKNNALRGNEYFKKSIEIKFTKKCNFLIKKLVENNNDVTQRDKKQNEILQALLLRKKTKISKMHQYTSILEKTSLYDKQQYNLRKYFQNENSYHLIFINN